MKTKQQQQDVNINELIFEETGIKKYNTNIENLFVYKVQKGWGWIPSILKNQKDERSECYGQQSIIIEYSDYVDGEFTGQETIHYNELEQHYQLT